MKKIYNLLLILFLITSCNFESADDSSGGGLFKNHKEAINIFTLTLPSSKTYIENETIDFTISHPYEITVTGTPQLSIDVGGNSEVANYLTGSGTKTLTFRYTVKALDLDLDGIEINSIINLNGGTLTFLDSGVTTNAVLTISNSPNTSGIKIDTTSPTITNAIPPIPSIYYLGQQLDLNIQFSENVNVIGTPTLSLDIGGAAKFANYLNGSGSNIIKFRYVVTSSDLDTDGISTSTPLNLNGGSIKDNAGNNADLVFTPPDTSLVFVDGDSPFVSTINLPTNKTYLLGESINFSLSFNEIVNVTGIPSVDLTIGPDTVSANYLSGSGTNILNFRFIVSQGLYDTNGISISNTIKLNAGSISDTTFNNARLALAPPLLPAVLVDSRIPEVVTITAPSDGNYLTGQNLDFIFEFSEAVIVTNIPKIEIAMATGSVFANYVSGSGSTVLNFRYIVGAGNMDNDGISFANSQINLNTNGLIKGVINNNDASLDFTGSEPVMTNIKINESAQTKLAITTQPTNTYKDLNISPAVTVEVRDVSDNIVVAASNNVTLSFGTDPSAGSANLLGTLTVPAVGGVATFSDLSIDAINSGYTFTVTSTGLTSDTSLPFDITEAPATKLIITGQPTNTVAGTTINPSLTVELRDANDNLVTSATDAVTLSFGTDPSAGGATLGGTLTVNAIGGIATFSDINIDKAFSGYTLTASALGLTNDTTSTFNITPDVKNKLSFKVEPIDTEYNSNIAPSITVEIQDSFGNKTTDTDTITLSINNDPSAGSAILGGTLTQAAINGVATFSDIQIDLVGINYNLKAVSAGLTDGISANFDILPGPPTQIILTGQPSNTLVGAINTPAITAELRDSNNNLVTNASNTVILSFGTDPSLGSAIIGGTKSKAAVNGIVTFNDITIDTTNTGYTFSLASGAMTSAVSNSFDIQPANATQLAFVQHPTNTVAGVNITPAITVELRDALNNIDTSATDSVTLSFGTDPSAGSATLSGTVTVNAVAGIATFSDINIDKAFNAYTLTASAAGLTSATSTNFNITPAAKNKLGFKVEPVNTPYGVNITPSITVEIQDSFGNKTTDTDSITLAINNNPGGSVLAGTTTIASVNGTATFSDINLDKTGVGYTLNAAAAGLTLATSASFDITATATQLIITQEPTNATNGSVIAPSITVEIRDALNNIVSAATNNVTLSFGTDPSAGSAVIGGTKSKAAVNGIVTFNDITIDTANTGYTFSLASGAMTPAVSNSFDIQPANATQLAFVQQPSNSIAGVDITPAITVELRDALNNIDTSATDSVTLSFGTDPSAGSATLSGTVTVNAVAGIATFSDINIDKAFNAYTLTASAAGLTSATSTNFNITPAAKNRLGFKVEPVNTPYGVNITPSITVEIQDSFGNKTTDTDSITLAINNNPGGSVLAGTTSQASVNGTATFSDINLDKTGAGYTLNATAPGLTLATSVSFDITATATQLIITQEPTNATNGSVIAPSITVEIRDALNNIVSAATNNVTLSFGTDPSAGSAVIGGTKTVAAVNGVATFTDIGIDTINTGYTFSFASAGLTSATSTTFNITQAPATKLAFTQQPTNAVAGVNINPSMTVELRDANDNLVNTATDSVTLSFGTDPSAGAATLSGTVTVNAVAGIATFSDINIDKAFNAYTLTASAAGLTSATSTNFNITPATKNKLGFKVEPVNTAYGVSITPAITVEIQDSFGNKTTDTDSITLAINNNPGGSVLAGTTTIASVNGTATFSDINLDKTGVGYTLNATAAGLTLATSASFDITAGAATQIIITTQPSNTASGGTISNIIAEIRDGSNNLVTGASNSVDIAISSDPSAGSAVFSGTKTVNASNGIVTFNDLSIDTINNGYSLVLTSVGLTGVITNTFNIIGPAVLTFNPATQYSFGSVTLGNTSSTTFLINHSGGPATSVGETTLAPPFSFKGGSYPGTGGTCGTTISSSCTLVINYAPTTATVSNETATIVYDNGSGIQNITRDVTGTGFSSTPTALNVTGANAVITNNCVPYTVNATDNNGNIVNVSSNEAVSLVVNNGTGTFYSDASCTTTTTTTTILSGTSNKVIYFKSATPNQNLTLIFNAATLSNTSRSISTSNEPISIIANISTEIITNECIEGEVSLVDTNGIKTGASTSQLIDITASGNELIYNDPFCTGLITQLSFAQYVGTKNIYIKNGTIESSTLSFTDNASLLNSDSANIDFVSALTWFDSNFGKRIKVSLNNLDQATAFTDLPILIKLDSSRINYADFKANGEDLRFTLNDHSTVLSHSIDTWNTSGTSYIWVKIPNMLSSTEMDIYMYYNYASATDIADNASVWSDYEGVWNMNKSGANFIDETGTGKDATAAGSVSTVAGPIGNAASFDGTSRLALTYDLALTLGRTSTLSFWLKTSQVGDATDWKAPGITGMSGTAPSKDLFYGYIKDTGRIGSSAGGGTQVESNFVVNDNTWRHVTVSRNETTGEFRYYVNGVLNGSGNSGTGFKNTSFYSFGATTKAWGGGGYYFLNGSMDSIKMSNSVLSDARIKAEYKFTTETNMTYSPVQTP